MTSLACWLLGHQWRVVETGRWVRHTLGEAGVETRVVKLSCDRCGKCRTQRRGRIID